jgi:hypothetical protein
VIVEVVQALAEPSFDGMAQAIGATRAAAGQRL